MKIDPFRAYISMYFSIALIWLYGFGIIKASWEFLHGSITFGLFIYNFIVCIIMLNLSIVWHVISARDFKKLKKER